jgi:UDP-N-acetylglucosamine:LPS N-acetylglucosamine transferase
LIPLPYGQRNEQRDNAAYLASLGLAKVLTQEDLTPETVYTEIEEMMEHRSSYSLRRDASELLHHDATEKIIATLFSVAEKIQSSSEKNAAA